MSPLRLCVEADLIGVSCSREKERQTKIISASECEGM